MTIQITGIEFDSAAEAIQHLGAGGRGVAISIGGKTFVVEQAEADRIAAMGVFFAYLFDHQMPDGTQRIMTVPVND